MSGGRPPRWLALAGFMGAGKTTVGERLALRLGVSFVDADRVVEELAEMTIPEIFSRRGELWFRRTEEKVIRRIVLGTPPGVLALGGGALESGRTRDLLARQVDVVWLRIPTDAAWRRVLGSDRPLAGERERFARRAAAREPVYADSADLTVDAELPPEDIVERVVAWRAAVPAERQ